MPENYIPYADTDVGEVRLECTTIGDKEKADLLDCLYIAKEYHEKQVTKFRRMYGGFALSLLKTHSNAIQRIIKLQDTIRDLPTPEN